LVKVHDLIREVVSLARHTFDRRLQVSALLDAEQDVIAGDSDQIQQILLNLALNARDAMADGPGSLRFQTSLEQIAEGATVAGMQPGLHLRVEISDTGVGIPAEHLDRIYDPFFTTKAVGKGTGLGLATAYGAVRNHGGAIDVESEPDRGTRFTLLLPLAGDARASQTELRPSAMVRGAGRILVVDDEPELLGVLRTALPEMGYEARFCSTGKAALQEYRRAEADYDLVLLDLDMPEMNGEECSRELRSVDEHVKVMFVTGHGQPEVLERLRRDGAADVLRKPFTLAELSQALARTVPGAARDSAAEPLPRREAGS
jgi:CheY-like chemotaxis protein